MLHATRSNRIQRLNEGHVLYELEGLVNPELPRTVGVNQKLAVEIKELRNNFIEIQPIQRSTLR